MAKTKKFQAESKQLLNLMIHSIYSNKDVFLRELISNASDALDKRQFYALQNEKLKADEFYIELIPNQKEKTLIIKDNGIGMDEEDLNKNLGTIAKSGTKEFMEKLEENKDNINTIGQFGVGFYSSFIVADKVEVNTKKVDMKAVKWISDGIEKYTIDESDKSEIGTEIKLYFKEEKDILEFLEENKIAELIKKYSDYVKYPIYMEMDEIEYEQPKEGSDEKPKEIKTRKRKILNSQKAIWKKDKKDITKEEYNDFYKSQYMDFTDPLKILHTKVEGTLNYELLAFIPSQKPFDYNTPNYKKGLDLYSKGILIENKLDYLIPDAFSFMRGLVDSEDLNLNISREMLQKDAIVTKLTKSIENKIQKELLKMIKKDRDNYNTLFDNFGRTLIFGMYDNYGEKKELIKDLVMFKSSNEEKYVTFKEYVERNATQDVIYYAAGDSIENIKQMPSMEKILAKGIEVLYFLNDVDEFAIQVLMEYEGKKFKSITDANLDLDTKEEKEKIEKQATDNKDLLENMKEILKDNVSDVKLTNKLTDSAVAIVNGEGMSLEMEKVLAQMPDNQNMKATKILEINPNHSLFTKLAKIKDNKEELTNYAKLLYQQALISEGFKIENPREYAKLVDELIIKAIK